MIDNVFLLSNTGEVLIEKQWNGRVKRTVCDLFQEEVAKYSKRSEVPPVITTSKYYLVHVYRSDLSCLSVVSKEVNPLFIIEAQHFIFNVMIDYFKTVSETAIRNHFSTVLQLLDEVIDGGFPFTTEPNQLKEMIIPPSLAWRVYENVAGVFSVAEAMPEGASSKIPWRKSNVKYVTNEIYFDLVEQIDATISASQSLLHSCIYGEIRTNSKLSGMPDLTLSFDKSHLMDDVSLHRSVRIAKFQKDRVMSFVPPDGHFKLASYKINGDVQIPIYVKPQLTYSDGASRVNITVGPKHISNKKPITDVVITLPLPSETISSQLSANVGIVKYDQKTQICRWEIGKIPNETTPMLEGTTVLPLGFKIDEHPVIRAEFQVKMYCSSGIKVSGLSIKGVKYKPFKGVRSVTQGGRFQIRTH